MLMEVSILSVVAGVCVSVILPGCLCPVTLRVLEREGDALTCALAGCSARSCIGCRDPRGLFVVSVGDVRRVLPSRPFAKAVLDAAMSLIYPDTSQF